MVWPSCPQSKLVITQYKNNSLLFKIILDLYSKFYFCKQICLNAFLYLYPLLLRRRFSSQFSYSFLAVHERLAKLQVSVITWIHRKYLKWPILKRRIEFVVDICSHFCKCYFTNTFSHLFLYPPFLENYGQ